MSTLTNLDLLIVDDEPDMVRGLARILSTRSIQVQQAFGGREAVEMVDQHCPTAVLMDMKMPDLDGIAAFARMREICPDLTVVFMTGFSEMEDRAISEGAKAVLRKPVDFSELFEVLGSISVN